MTVRMQRDHGFNEFYLILPRTAPSGQRQGQQHLWLLHHQQWRSPSGNKRNGLLEKLRYDGRSACLRSIAHKVNLSCHPTYLLIFKIIIIILYISNQDALFAILLQHDCIRIALTPFCISWKIILSDNQRIQNF